MKTLFPIVIMVSIFGTAFGQQANSSKTSTETTSVSITNSDSQYSLDASFSPAKEQLVKALIVKAVGKSGEISSDGITWHLKNTYSIKLVSRQLKIKLDKQKASISLYNLISQLGTDVQTILTKPSLR